MTAKKTAKKAPAKKVVTKKTPAKKASAKKSPSKKAPAKKAPSKKAPAKKASVKKAPAKKAPAKKAPVKKVPVKKAPVKKATVKKVNSEKITTTELEAEKGVKTTTIITPASDVFPVPAIDKSEQNQCSSKWNLHKKVHQFISFLRAVVAQLLGRIACHNQYISASFQPRALQKQVSNSSFDLLTRNDMALSILPDK